MLSRVLPFHIRRWTRRTLTGGGEAKFLVSPLAMDGLTPDAATHRVVLAPGLYRRGDTEMTNISYVTVSMPTEGYVWRTKYLPSMGASMVSVALPGPWSDSTTFALMEVIPSRWDLFRHWLRQPSRARWHAFRHPRTPEAGIMGNVPFPDQSMTPKQIEQFLYDKLLGTDLVGDTTRLIEETPEDDRP